MAKVKNKKIINKISFASLKNNKSRNSIAVIAIALTTILFTSLFTIGFGMKESIELYTMRMVGTTFHGEFKYLNEQQFETLKAHKLIKEHGHRRMIGAVINDEFRKENVEISYGDENYIKRGFVYPTVGRLPKEKNEIITDTKVLDLLGVPHEVGQRINLKFEVYDISGGNLLETIEDEFVLSGFYPLDPLMRTRMIFTSREYVDGLKLPKDNIGLNVMFSNSLGIIKKLDKVIEEKGYSDFYQDPNYISTGINWGYMSEGLKNPDPTVIIGGIAIILIIISAGYLIIYNIFQISVLSDIRFYGLLKTIGTTSKQLKKIIRRQALFLSAIGIPLGLILGYIIGNLLIPIIAKELQLADSIRISFSPLIFVFASAFSLITVFISSSKPGKIAGRVFPIEVTKMGDVNVINYNNQKRIEKEVKISNMAISNLSRNKIRTIIVILSMSLSLILFNSIYTFTNGYDSEKYVDEFMNTDFNLGSIEYFKYMFREEKDSISSDIMDQVKNTEGFLNGGSIYYNFNELWIEDESILYPDGKPPVQVFGLDEFLIHKQKTVDSSIDINKFMSGNYVLIGVNKDRNLSYSNKLYRVGEKITLHTKGGSREFEIMGMIIEGYYNNARSYYGVALANGDTIMAPLFYLPSSTYKQMIENPWAMVYQFDIEDDKTAYFEELLVGLSEKPNLNLNYESRQKLLDESEGMQKMILIVGGALSLIIGIVGIMNFINSVITSIMTRKREFALLQSIGMTNKQINALLIKEGLIYSLSTMTITSFLAVLISFTILKSFEIGMPFYTHKFTVLPLILSLPIILLLGFIVPLLVNKIMMKESIIERIRKDN